MPARMTLAHRVVDSASGMPRRIAVADVPHASVVDVTAILARMPKVATVAQPMRQDQPVRLGRIHEPIRGVPAGLVEVARLAGMVQAVGDVAGRRIATDIARPVAVGDEIGNQGLEASGNALGDRDRDAGRRLHANEPTADRSFGEFRGCGRRRSDGHGPRRREGH